MTAGGRGLTTRRPVHSHEPAVCRPALRLLRTVHRTRVAFKHYRYMVEAMVECLPGVTPGGLAAMRRFQGVMGSVQDIEVLLTELDRFLKKAALDADSAREFRNRLLHQRQQCVRRCLAVLDQLADFRPGNLSPRFLAKPVKA